VVTEQQWVPYATAGPVTLHLPSDRVEAIGFHQSALDGAQPQNALPGAPRWFRMSSRDRDTTPQGAADIVVQPDHEIRAPVTGTVLRAGTYTLYCDYVDQYAVIEPDARPGWEVKVLHMEGLTVKKGQRVEAGVTWLALHARVLPFPSQVEEDTGLPRWPHVHVEVDDPTVPDRPTEAPCP
jgi:murein DD-endopeptidase MepM/ murein hydrolase activator NlpD